MDHLRYQDFTEASQYLSGEQVGIKACWLSKKKEELEHLDKGHEFHQNYNPQCHPVINTVLKDGLGH